MLEHSPESGTFLEVIIPGRTPQYAVVTHTPFLIGRGSETGNHLQLEDRRISRRCAALMADESGYLLEDRGHRLGLFVNGNNVERVRLRDGDLIDFGLEDGCELIFHSLPEGQSIETMLTRMGSIPSITATQPGNLGKLKLLLEATSLLHSQLSLDSVLGTMLEHAIAITNADRGLLLEGDGSGELRQRLVRASKSARVQREHIPPSQTAVRQAIERQSSVITADLGLADSALKSAQSVVAQRLRSVVVIPLYAMPRASSDESIVLTRGQLLGVLYCDSTRPAAFSNLDRQILDALGMESASILDNARLVERERERQRLEQELSIARYIQKALLPQGMNKYPHLSVSGIHLPCHEVGGDYFDVFPISEQRTAVLIADVSGKGLGAALLTTILQGALSGMSMGAEPVRVFNHINKFLCEHSELGRYATMFFGILGHDGTLEYIRAGHPSPLLLRRGRVSELYTGGSFPVGLIEETQFTSTTVNLEPEDTLVLFSDGITEAENANRELFQTFRLREVLSDRSSEPLESLQQLILDSVNTFSAGAAQSDDLTLLIARYHARAEEPVSSA